MHIYIHTYIHTYIHAYIATYIHINHMYTQDLSKYESDEILHEALHLLQRYYSAEENLFEKAIQTQVKLVAILLMNC